MQLSEVCLLLFVALAISEMSEHLRKYDLVPLKNTTSEARSYFGFKHKDGTIVDSRGVSTCLAMQLV